MLMALRFEPSRFFAFVKEPIGSKRKAIDINVRQVGKQFQ